MGPPDDDGSIRELFDGHLGARPEVLSLLDLSSKEHYFGVALESLVDQEPTLATTASPYNSEAFACSCSPRSCGRRCMRVPSRCLPSRTALERFFGAETVNLVPVLPGAVAEEWVRAVRRRGNAGAIFSLPFGLRAFARFDASEFQTSTMAAGLSMSTSVPP